MNGSVTGEVLVVDDTPANLQLLTGMLQERGYQVRAVPSGPLALRAARARPPEVILLDVNMPDMDGYEVCRRLKQDAQLSDIPVLFISALSEPLDKVMAFRAGGVDYVTKPFQIDEVLARIDTHVRLRRMRLELEERNRTIEGNYAKLRQMEQLRDSLTHMLVHDMRSPLTGIIASLQFLQEDLEGNIPAANAEDLERGLSSVHAVVRMINDLLDVSRMEASELPIERSRCDLASLVQDAVKSLGAHTRARMIDLSGLEGAPTLECDRELIHRVLVNLLGNALKFTPAGGIVRVRSKQDNGVMQIEVSDTGPGIPRNAHMLIFEKFGQAKTHERSKRYSSGIGLAFCRLAVQAHGGAIGVISEPGQGATFWFTIPE
jgi:two-component system, sensor histidine kinase and response regulator